MLNVDGDPGRQLEKTLDEFACAVTAAELAAQAVDTYKQAVEKAADEFVARSDAAGQVMRQAREARAAADEALRRARAERAGAQQSAAAFRAARQNVARARQAAREARKTADALRRQCDLAREVFQAWRAGHPREPVRQFILDLARRRHVTEQQMYRILMVKSLRRTEEEMRDDLNRILTGRATPSAVARERGISRQAVWGQFQRYLVTSGRAPHAPRAS
jgi:hypothetical protein